MADKTLAQLITMVQQELYQIQGASTQVYGEANVSQKIVSSFDMIFSQRWKRHRTILSRVLDGTTGEVTVDITTIKSFDDIERIYLENVSRPLTVMDMHTNPSMLTGTTPLGYTPSQTTNKLFTVWPIAATGNLTITGFAHPGTFSSGTTVPFDQWAITYMAAWQYMTDDGSNPDSAAKFQGLFETRLKQLRSNENSEPINLNPSRSFIPDRWTEAY